MNYYNQPKDCVKRNTTIGCDFPNCDCREYDHEDILLNMIRRIAFDTERTAQEKVIDIKKMWHNTDVI